MVRGVFEFLDTYGLPLDIVVDRLRQERVVPDWLYLYNRCIESGWNPTSTWERLRIMVGDVYGPDYRLRWELKMRAHIETIPT